MKNDIIILNVNQTNTTSEESKENDADTTVTKDKNPVILIIEDDPVLCRMYTEKFKFEGYTVLVARDGEEGLRMAQDKNVDLIILDIMLPRMSGIDLLSKLRQTNIGKDKKVVALTNLAEPSEKEKAIKLGVLEYLVKAMQTPEDVITKIKKYLIED